MPPLEALGVLASLAPCLEEAHPLPPSPNGPLLSRPGRNPSVILPPLRVHFPELPSTSLGTHRPIPTILSSPPTRALPRISAVDMSPQSTLFRFKAGSGALSPTTLTPSTPYPLPQRPLLTKTKAQMREQDRWMTKPANKSKETAVKRVPGLDFSTRPTKAVYEGFPAPKIPRPLARGRIVIIRARDSALLAAECVVDDND